MTKKHFQVMADYIADAINGGASPSVIKELREFALYLAEQLSPRYYANAEQLKTFKGTRIGEPDEKGGQWVSKFDQQRFDAWIAKRTRSAA